MGIKEYQVWRPNDIAPALTNYLFQAVPGFFEHDDPRKTPASLGAVSIPANFCKLRVACVVGGLAFFPFTRGFQPKIYPRIL